MKDFFSAVDEKSRHIFKNHSYINVLKARDAFIYLIIERKVSQTLVRL